MLATISRALRLRCLLAMYFPDLDTRCQIASGPRVRAIGWLSVDHDFTRGSVDERVAAVAAHLAEEGWIHIFAMGPHLCELCRDARDSRNLLVPASDVLFVAPAMIAHYIRAHEYAPPPEFCAAVLACPDPETDEYYAALRRFVDVFSLDEPAFDRFTREHREQRSRHRAKRALEASRKRFTWD